jgi:ssDNA-binding Zn-finger/Zn-ribbon topoisomerase 1
MIRTLIALALNRSLSGEDRYIKCTRCNTMASALEGAPLLISASIQVAPTSLRQTITPPEWICPACGRSGPLEVGELLVNDTAVKCRRRWICRYTWTVPSTLAVMTCPRCRTVQPGPAGPDTGLPPKEPRPGG